MGVEVIEKFEEAAWPSLLPRISALSSETVTLSACEKEASSWMTPRGCVCLPTRSSSTIPCLPAPCHPMHPGRLISLRFSSRGWMQAVQHNQPVLRSWNRRLIALEAGLGHTALCLRILHERLPHETGARILGHEHCDAGVDAHNVLVIPVIQRVEGIDKAVAAPGLRIMRADVLQHPNGGDRQKRQRTSRCRGNHRSVNRAHGRWSAPDHVPLVRVRGRNPPQIVAVIGKRLAQFNAKAAVYIRRNRGIREVVGKLVPLAPEVEPRLRVLVYKQRRKRTDVLLAVILEPGPLPCQPCRSVQRVRAGTHPQ